MKKLETEENAFDYQIAVALIIVIASILLFFLYKRGKKIRNNILLTGLCDSGKTLIFAQLLHNVQIMTHTSIKENIETYDQSNGTLKIVDIPGHERLRDKFFEQYKSSAKAIVFVVDSLTISQDVRDAAEFIYNILIDPVIINNCPDFLVFCNKQDQSLAKGSNAVRSLFEKELNTLRVTKASQLDSVDPKVKKAATLGDTKKDFNFSSLHYKVDFVEGYASHKNGSVDINHLRKWVEKQF